MDAGAVNQNMDSTAVLGEFASQFRHRRLGTEVCSADGSIAAAFFNHGLSFLIGLIALGLRVSIDRG